MTDTEFGPGGSARTFAQTPAAPVLAGDTSVTLLVTPGADDNPPYTGYALFNVTDAAWLDADGAGAEAPVWRTREDWGTLAARGLTPQTTYTIAVRARNLDGDETDFGPTTTIATYSLATVTLPTLMEVRKASSTVGAPAFMSGVTGSISLAGKNLADLGFVADSITGLDLPRAVPDEELVPGDHTWRVWSEYFAARRIVMEGYIHGSTPDDLRLRLAYLKSFLAAFEGNPWRSGTPVRLERGDLPGRHWEVRYDALDTVETLGKRELASSARVRIALKCPSPYAAANDVSRAVFVPGAGSFTSLDLGNAPTDAVYVITGPAADPAFAVGDMVFLCDFADGLAFTDAVNATRTGTYTPASGEAAALRTTDTGMGILADGTDTIAFAVTGNPADGAWAVVVIPRWQSSARESDAVVFEHRADADNLIRLSWDASACAWAFLKRANGLDATVVSPAQAFTAGTPIVLGITYDASNAGGMKLYIDGSQAGISADTAPLAAAPATLTLHRGDGALQPDAVVDMAAGWSRMLSADEMLRVATDQAGVRNHNAAVAYTGTLDAGDLLMLDSRQKTAVLVDVSEGSRANVLAAITGGVPALVPGRRRAVTDRTQTMVHALAAMGGMEVRYRRRYL